MPYLLVIQMISLGRCVVYMCTTPLSDVSVKENAFELEQFDISKSVEDGL